MTLRLVYLSFLFVVYADRKSQMDDLISPLLKVNTNSQNPGIFIRFTKSGIAYLREIGMNTVNKEVNKIKLPRITQSIDAGRVTISDAYISRYLPPIDYNLQLSPPDMFTWSMSKMHIRVNGIFEVGTINPLLLPAVPLLGKFEAVFGQIGLVIAVRLAKRSNGAPIVRSIYCQADVGYVDLNVSNTGVITDFFINGFKAFIIAHFKPIVEERVCEIVKNVININMNQILSAMPLKISINQRNIDIIGDIFDFGDEQPQKRFHNILMKNTSIANIFHEIKTNNLILDYRLVRKPRVEYDSIGMPIKGEISWNGIGGTPFYAPNVEFTPSHGTHMIEFFGTDYIANSMLYHAFRQKYMDLTIGSESSKDLERLLKTTCEFDFCIGDQLGLLSEQFPNHEVEINFTPRKSPIMVFVQNRTRFRIYGVLTLYVRPKNMSNSKIKVLVCDSTLTSSINFWIIKQRIFGNASVEVLNLTLQETVIKQVNQETLNDLSLFAAEFIQRLLLDALKTGFLLPEMRGVVLQNPS